MGRSERPRVGQHIRLSPVGQRTGHSQIRFLPQEGTRSCWRLEPWRPGGGDTPYPGCCSTPCILPLVAGEGDLCLPALVLSLC